ncbi:hypothetical protein ACJH6J_28715 [Mycobacterium sp. SMC-18]|uniref:hypothetical protein n=1 Tax=Mycobacteriaceae TaxID=1762 RepID=UPI001BB36111|nr:MULTISPECIES: hypothetical protein [unclassified Mycolicibacterium]BCI84766.1 hypothetical protein MTY66_63910 [Mycolicibacterium sp. TY66]BCJ85012.1 hypothetical protein MTY81_63850 [Mycolicibacterium sp. TY81]
MSAVTDNAWQVVLVVVLVALLLFAPLVYAAVLGARDEPTQRLVAFVRALAALVEAFRTGGPRS